MSSTDSQAFLRNLMSALERVKAVHPEQHFDTNTDDKLNWVYAEKMASKVGANLWDQDECKRYEYNLHPQGNYKAFEPTYQLAEVQRQLDAIISTKRFNQSFESFEFKSLKEDLQKLIKQNEPAKGIARFCRIAPYIYNYNGKLQDPIGIAKWDNIKMYVADKIADIEVLSHAEFEGYYKDYLNHHVISALESIKDSDAVVNGIMSWLNATFRYKESSCDIEQARQVTLELMPKWLGLYRGDHDEIKDCTPQNAALFSLVADTYWYRDAADKIIGYVFVVPVKAEIDGELKEIPYILTPNGKTMKGTDIPGIINAVGEIYQSQYVIIPDLDENDYLTNFESITTAIKELYTKDFCSKMAIQSFPEGWDVIEKDYNNGYSSPDEIGQSYIVDTRNFAYVSELKMRPTDTYLDHDYSKESRFERAIMAGAVAQYIKNFDTLNGNELKDPLANILDVTPEQAAFGFDLQSAKGRGLTHSQVVAMLKVFPEVSIAEFCRSLDTSSQVKFLSIASERSFAQLKDIPMSEVQEQASNFILNLVNSYTSSSMLLLQSAGEKLSNVWRNETVNQSLMKSLTERLQSAHDARAWLNAAYAYMHVAKYSMHAANYQVRYFELLADKEHPINFAGSDVSFTLNQPVQLGLDIMRGKLEQTAATQLSGCLQSSDELVRLHTAKACFDLDQDSFNAFDNGLVELLIQQQKEPFTEEQLAKIFGYLATHPESITPTCVSKLPIVRTLFDINSDDAKSALSIIQHLISHGDTDVIESQLVDVIKLTKIGPFPHVVNSLLEANINPQRIHEKLLSIPGYSDIENVQAWLSSYDLERAQFDNKDYASLIKALSDANFAASSSAMTLLSGCQFDNGSERKAVIDLLEHMRSSNGQYASDTKSFIIETVYKNTDWTHPDNVPVLNALIRVCDVEQTLKVASELPNEARLNSCLASRFSRFMEDDQHKMSVFRQLAEYGEPGRVMIYRAVRALGQFDGKEQEILDLIRKVDPGFTEAMPYLIEVCVEANKEDLLQSIFAEAEYHPKYASLDRLIELLRNDNGKLAPYLAQAISLYGPDANKAVPQIYYRLRDKPDYAVQLMTTLSFILNDTGKFEEGGALLEVLSCGDDCLKERLVERLDIKVIEYVDSYIRELHTLGNQTLAKQVLNAASYLGLNESHGPYLWLAQNRFESEVNQLIDECLDTLGCAVHSSGWLIQMLESDSDKVRMHALESIAHVNDSVNLYKAAIMKSAEQEHYSIKCCALDALTKLYPNDDQTQHILFETLNTDGREGIQEHAAKCINALNINQENVNYLYDNVNKYPNLVIAALMPTFNKYLPTTPVSLENTLSRLNSLELDQVDLSQLVTRMIDRSTENAHKLVHELKHSSDPVEQKLFAKILGQMGAIAQPAMPGLAAYLNEDWSLAPEIMNAMATIGTCPEEVVDVVELMLHGNADEQEAALRALCNLDTLKPETIDAVMPLINLDGRCQLATNLLAKHIESSELIAKVSEACFADYDTKAQHNALHILSQSKEIPERGILGIAHIAFSSYDESLRQAAQKIFENAVSAPDERIQIAMAMLEKDEMTNHRAIDYVAQQIEDTRQRMDALIAFYPSDYDQRSLLGKFNSHINSAMPEFSDQFAHFTSNIDRFSPEQKQGVLDWMGCKVGELRQVLTPQSSSSIQALLRSIEPAKLGSYLSLFNYVTLTDEQLIEPLLVLSEQADRYKREKIADILSVMSKDQLAPHVEHVRQIIADKPEGYERFKQLDLKCNPNPMLEFDYLMSSRYCDTDVKDKIKQIALNHPEKVDQWVAERILDKDEQLVSKLAVVFSQHQPMPQSEKSLFDYIQDHSSDTRFDLKYYIELAAKFPCTSETSFNMLCWVVQNDQDIEPSQEAIAHMGTSPNMALYTVPYLKMLVDHESEGVSLSAMRSLLQLDHTEEGLREIIPLYLAAALQYYEYNVDDYIEAISVFDGMGEHTELVAYYMVRDICVGTYDYEENKGHLAALKSILTDSQLDRNIVADVIINEFADEDIQNKDRHIQLLRELEVDLRERPDVLTKIVHHINTNHSSGRSQAIELLRSLDETTYKAWQAFHDKALQLANNEGKYQHYINLGLSYLENVDTTLSAAESLAQMKQFLDFFESQLPDYVYIEPNPVSQLPDLDMGWD